MGRFGEAKGRKVETLKRVISWVHRPSTDNEALARYDTRMAKYFHPMAQPSHSRRLYL